MKRKMKSLLTLVLSVLLIFSAIIPAFAAVGTTGSRVPVVMIGGDGDLLADKDGNYLSSWSDVFSNLSEKSEDEDGSEDINKSVANVLLPFLIDGLLTGNYERYYENFQKEISEMFGDLLLDENGEVANGSGLAERRIKSMENDLKRDSK